MTATDTTVFAILISAGWPTNYGPKVGWDSLYTTRREAEQAKARAEQHDGWSAKVIEMTADEAARFGWT